MAAVVVAAPAMAGTVTGTATYRERIALPPDAEFEVVIQDVARADAPATVIGRQRIAPAGQPPFRFAIPYEESAVSPRGRYSLRATVRHQGRLLFTTDTFTPVLDGSNQPVELLLKRVSGLVTAEQVDERRQQVVPLRGTSWRLLAIAGPTVTLPEPPARPIALELSADEPRLAASAGCNRLIGGFSLEGDMLRFSQLASTQMACGPELMALERRFTEALTNVRRWSIDKRSLLLQDARGR
ncbi:MAG: YbaY family lipoprotein [Synechococcaceae cyanobacterium]